MCDRTPHEYFDMRSECNYAYLHVLPPPKNIKGVTGNYTIDTPSPDILILILWAMIAIRLSLFFINHYGNIMNRSQLACGELLLY